MADIRPATQSDLEAINEIYNHYVRETPITFDIEPITMEQRLEWFGQYSTGGRHRLLVATEDRVVGYACSSQLFPRRAYETSVTSSIYCAPDAVGKGIGTQLYAALFGAIGPEDVHRAYGGITLPNDASVALHEKFGFSQVAFYSEQGRKFDRYWDVGWYEKEL